ncbi:MAG TPA: beta-galactosidase [Bacteroidales bacterium]|nr:beta-galactosidase [Bacteroidales bacterium]HPT20799.1 beta-galactosidase [Bacteroidales bacterium]
MKKVLFFLLVISTYLLSCKEQTKNIKEDKQIPIIAWYSIPANETTLSRYEELKETGITYNLGFFPDSKSMAIALDTAQKAGIKMFVSCPELKTNTEETVKRFMNHPAVAGYMLRDEPGRKDFPELGEWAKKIQAVDNIHPCYLNLFPNYASEEQLGTKTYKEHVDLFIREVPLQLLSFDHYPVIGDSLRYQYYENLEIISEAAKNAGKPFWAFSLSVAHGPYPVPTAAQLRLQVFSDLAYGAQGIQYFTYWTPNDTAWNFNNGPISRDGKRTVVYDRVKQMNREIKGLSDIFMGASVTSVSHTGDIIPRGTKPLTTLPEHIKSLKTEGLGAVVSVLKNGQYTYLVIVNRDFKNSMKLSIECDKEVRRVFKDGTSVPANAYQPAIEVDPGDITIYSWTN